MGLQIMEREVDVEADASCLEGERQASVTASVRGVCELATGEEDLPNLDCWTEWSEAKADDLRPSNALLI